MSKIIRRTEGTKKEVGAALIVALQLTTLTLIGLMAPLASGPQQSANTSANSQITADQTQNQTVQAPTGTDRSALRASAVFANKVYGQRATEIFNLAATRAASAEQSKTTDGATNGATNGAINEATNGATLTSD